MSPEVARWLIGLSVPLLVAGLVALVKLATKTEVMRNTQETQGKDIMEMKGDVKTIMFSLAEMKGANSKEAAEKK